MIEESEGLLALALSHVCCAPLQALPANGPGSIDGLRSHSSDM